MLVKGIADVLIYLQPFPSNSSRKIQRSPFSHIFLHILASPGYAPGTIAVNFTWIEREFNACQTPRSMYPCTTHLSSTVSEIQRVIGRKLRHFHTHLCLAAPQGVTPSEFREDLTHKTRMNGLSTSCGEESMTIYSAVLIQYQRVTDGQTHGQTDGRPAYSYYVLQHS